jgi:hypothetical protein
MHINILVEIMLFVVFSEFVVNLTVKTGEREAKMELH